MIDTILKYFTLTDKQKQQFEQIGNLYPEWNAKINVISRKDIDNLWVNHILHSLAIAKFINPVTGTTFLDMGTGGGFPGIPLAIMWPECKLHLIDRIGKKIKVAQDIAQQIGLDNVTFQHGDIGECGLICLKGGDLSSELHGIKNPVIEEPLNRYFDEPFFETKKLIYVQI